MNKAEILKNINIAFDKMYDTIEDAEIIDDIKRIEIDVSFKGNDGMTHSIRVYADDKGSED